MADIDRSKDAEGQQRYRAPALDKGLDIVELLAKEARPLTVSAMAQRLGRSHAELFRMVQVLDYRGYITQHESGEGYVLSSKLFSLVMEQPPMRGLIDVALPAMRQLARELEQSCHLVVHSRGEMVVVARVESGAQIGFSVRIGYRQPLIETVSGTVLYAFQSAEAQAQMESSMTPKPAPAELKAFRSRAREARERGFELAESRFVSGITDVSVPILRGVVVAAALTVPLVKSTQLRFNLKEASATLQRTAAVISSELLLGDSRV